MKRQPDARAIQRDDRQFRDDQQLVAALRSRSEHAFTELVRRYHGPLIRLAMVYVSSRAVAEEVVQDTWLAVLEGIDRFEGRSSLRTWLFRILTNQAKTRGVRERRWVPFSALASADIAIGDDPAVDRARFRPPSDSRWPGHWIEPPADLASLPEEVLMGRETLGIVAQALEVLPPAQRLVMTMRDVNGWTSADVCDVLEISPGNQRVLLHRARSRVRAELERYLQGRRLDVVPGVGETCAGGPG